jgi:hypothetical protein
MASKEKLLSICELDLSSVWHVRNSTERRASSVQLMEDTLDGFPWGRHCQGSALYSQPCSINESGCIDMSERVAQLLGGSERRPGPATVVSALIGKFEK